jgi:hypothetical protein
MQNFFEALISEGKNEKLPEEFNFFGKLIGSWKISYINNNANARKSAGEWHFSWILEGTAIQDVIVLSKPDEEIGTTVRVYNPVSNAWDIAYFFAGKIIRLEARKQDGMVVLTHIGNERRKWVFAKIGDSDFHWQDVTVKENGKWHINADLYAERE